VFVDITNHRSAPLELQATVPDCMVPFAPILDEGRNPFSMFVDLIIKYDWVLEPVIYYSSVDRRTQVLERRIIRPAQAKFGQLVERRTKQLQIEKAERQKVISKFKRYFVPVRLTSYFVLGPTRMRACSTGLVLSCMLRGAFALQSTPVYSSLRLNRPMIARWR
jgi:hypothetical protein